MPEIKLQHIMSCSSEDKNNPAENLLKPDGVHKWKSASNGEKFVSAVIQFEKSSQIHSIDIGNEGSAFVEVLVGRATASSDQDFQVIMVASSFMAPMESRNGTNRNAVRMFGQDKLSKAVCTEKWDRVKIVCTQPFNKNSTYGLSFVKFHSPPEPGEKNRPSEGLPASQNIKKLGAFSLKADENGSTPVKVGSYFASRAKEKDESPLTGAAAIRAASKLAAESQPPAPTPKPAIPERKEEHPPVSSSRSAESAYSSINKGKRKHSQDDNDEKDRRTPPIQKPSMQKQSTSISSVTSVASAGKDSHSAPPLKKTKSEPPKQTAKAFGCLMEKVVIVLSGFQNPLRGDLREQAMEMGAKYQTDWKKGCTHLICAFANTPKYNVVEGKGKIVKKEWIFDSYKQKILKPWRKYRLGDAESPSESSESEDDGPATAKHKPSSSKKTSPSTSKTESKHKTPVKESEKKLHGKSPIQDDDSGDTDKYAGSSGSGDDTEDEIRRIREKETTKKDKDTSPKIKSPTKLSNTNNDDLYGDSTDEDEAARPSKEHSDAESSDSGLPELPDFFTDKHFFLYGVFEPVERRLIVRFITAFNGTLHDYMADSVNYVISSSEWDENFDDALSDNPSLIFVRPKWVYTCNEKGKLTPYQPHIIVPK